MSYLQLPPVHGYGVPQILSQWQAGLDSRENQKRYETELDFKKKESARAEKQFDMQTQTHKAELENKKLTRYGSALDNFAKQTNLAKGYFSKNKGLAINIFQGAVGNLQKITGMEIDASTVTNQFEADQLLQKVAADSVQNLYSKAMAEPTKYNVALLEIAKNKAYQIGIKDGTYDNYKVETPKPGEGQSTLGENQIRIDATGKTIATGPKKEGSLTDVQKQAAMDKRAGYVPQTKKEAIELRKSGATQINLGEVADKIKTQEQAKDEAKWIGTSAREEAEKIAKNTIGDDWVDLTKDEKSAQTQTVLHRKLISIYGDKVKYGQDNGVLGWYLQDETGAMKLIKRWQ
mgnify:CR=1 FL=1